MTVYVDDMYKYPIGSFRRMKMSHLIATTEAELHAMAGQLGMKRSWFQGDHYDIALGKRARAIELGAIEISYRTCGLMCAVVKMGGALPDPSNAELIWQSMRAERSIGVVKPKQGELF